MQRNLNKQCQPKENVLFMKNNVPARILSIFFMLFVFSSCKKDELKTAASDTKNITGTKVTLYTCSEKQAEPYICFDSLLTDSRCPANVLCVWEGTALIKVTFHETFNVHQFIMSLKGFPPVGYTDDTTINGYRIIFTKLDPYPSITNPQQQTSTAYFDITP